MLFQLGQIVLTGTDNVEDYNFRKIYLVPELNSKILHGSYSRHRCMREEIVMVQGSDVLKE